MSAGSTFAPRLEGHLFWFVFVFQAIFFINYIVVDSTALTRVAAVLGMALPLLVLVILGPARSLFSHPSIIWLLLFMAYVTASLAWAGPLSADEQSNVLRKLVIYTSTMLATVWVYSTRPEAVRWMLAALGWASVVAAIAAAVAHHDAFFSTERLTGLGGLGNELDAGIAFGAGALVWMHFYRLQRRPLYLALMVLTLFAMFSTLGRSVVVAFVVGLIVYRLATNRRRAPREAMLGLAVLSLMLIATWLLRPAGTIEDSCRIDLFSAGWQQFLENPLHGQGIKRFSRIDACQKVFNGAHNLFLEVLRYTGVIGLALLCGLLASIGRAYAAQDDKGAAAPLLMLAGFGWTMMMVNGQFIAIGPRLPWLVVWMPLMAIIGLHIAQLKTRPKEHSA